MKKIGYIIIFLLIIIGFFTIYQFIPEENQFCKITDEAYYLEYSKELSINGILSYPALVKKYIENESLWIWPSPLRVGYFILSSAWFKLAGVSFRSLSLLSLFCFFLYLLVSFHFSRKLFGLDASVLIVLLLAFSPLTMGMAMRALTDSMGNLFIACSIWMFLDFLSEQKILKFILFEVVYVYSIIVREQSITLVCFFCLFFLIYKYGYKAEIKMKYFFAILLTPFILVGLIWFIASQNFDYVFKVCKLWRTLPGINEYSIIHCRGPWFRYIIDFILISPVTTVFSLSFVSYCFINKKMFEDYKVTYFLTLFVVYFILLSSFDYNKNIRYALTLDMILRVFAVFLIKEIFRGSKFAYRFGFFTAVSLCALDYNNFLYLFCIERVYDPVSLVLLRVRNFIP